MRDEPEIGIGVFRGGATRIVHAGAAKASADAIIAPPLRCACLPMPDELPSCAVEPLAWRDGQPWSERFDDRYFSSASGLNETRHVFLAGNRLAERFAALRPGDRLVVGETGFGTGLNFLCTQHLFEQTAPGGARLLFRSVERWPLAPQALRRALALWPELQPLAGELLSAWEPPAPGRQAWDFGAVRLELDIADVADALARWDEAGIDAWFLDGFAPAKNPQMWSDAVLARVARAARGGATLATYTSAGRVRRGLQAAGFDMRRVPGHGRKREMLVGVRTR